MARSILVGQQAFPTGLQNTLRPVWLFRAIAWIAIAVDSISGSRTLERCRSGRAFCRDVRQANGLSYSG